jgi:hypothetical protein
VVVDVRPCVVELFVCLIAVKNDNHCCNTLLCAKTEHDAESDINEQTHIDAQ